MARTGKVQAFDAKLAAIEQLKSAETEETRDAGLRKGLADRNNYIAAKAARVAGEARARNLAEDLCAAFDRFLVNPAKSDPQCWAKIAIAKALDILEHGDPDVLLRGLRHVQMEPVWGGQEDTAGPLRAHCAGALVNCRGIRDVDALEHLLEALVDPDKTVRAEAARAIGRIDRPEAALLLRLRALTGDAEPEPLGAVFSGVLAIDGGRAIPFVARFLTGPSETAQEAALALGATHDPSALEALLAALDRPAEPETRTSLMLAVALTRLPQAIDFLFRQAEDGSRDALRALGTIPLPEDQRARVNALANRRS